MHRKLYFIYGISCYALFLGVFAWMALFVGDLLLPRTVDSVPAAGTALPAGAALAIDLGLILLFGLQHSIMARPRFKRWWTRMVPAEIERSTYVLSSCVALAAIMLLWQPLGGVVWEVTHPVARAVLWAVFGVGWLMIPGVSLLINHFDLFGARQVWLALKGRSYEHLPFGTPGLYRFIRHPLYVGWGLAFWVTPSMTVGHLLFAVGMSAYMLLAIPMEERDLIDLHGEDYVQYRRRVPALVPTLSRKRDADRIAA